MLSRGTVPRLSDLGRASIQASGRVAAQLEMEAGESVFRIERLRTGDGEPMAIERAYLTARVAPGLLDEPLEDGSLHDVLQDRYGIVLDAGELTIEAATLDAHDASLLAVPRTSPALILTRRSFSGGQAVEYAVSTYRGACYQLRVAFDLPCPRRHR